MDTMKEPCLYKTFTFSPKLSDMNRLGDINTLIIWLF